MNSIDSIFVQRLVARLRKDREERLYALLSRKPYEDYVNRIGYIAALNDVLEIIEDVFNELTSPENDRG